MRVLVILTFAFGIAACAPDEPISEWRVTIRLPGAELPVHLHLPPDGGAAWFRNGSEKVMIPEVSQEAERFVLRFPAFNNTVVLERSANRLNGSLTLVKRGYEQEMALEGRPDPGYRFVPDPRPDVDLTGRWEVTFVDDSGAESLAIAEFDQQNGMLSGTFLTPTGDHRYLAGEVDGDRLYLSTFDGAHAFVYTAQARPDGTLEGDFWSGTRWHESWTARRNFDATLPDAYSLTYIREGYDGLEFTFPDLEGHPVSLDDEKFRGKVVLVNLSGTWCPNCADEVEFLSAYYRGNRDRGLEIITLLYEHFEDFERAARQGKALVAKHDIGFDVLIAGVSDKTEAARTLPMLNQVLAFPTLIFVDRNGTVRRIHTGFAGPGTGRHFERFTEEFHAIMEELLREDPRTGGEAVTESSPGRETAPP